MRAKQSIIRFRAKVYLDFQVVFMGILLSFALLHMKLDPFILIFTALIMVVILARVLAWYQVTALTMNSNYAFISLDYVKIILLFLLYFHYDNPLVFYISFPFFFFIMLLMPILSTAKYILPEGADPDKKCQIIAALILVCNLIILVFALLAICNSNNLILYPLLSILSIIGNFVAIEGLYIRLFKLGKI